MCLYGSVNRTVCFFLLLEAQETHSQNEIIPPSFSHDSAVFHDAIIQLLSANLIIFQGDFYCLTPLSRTLLPFLHLLMNGWQTMNADFANP